MRGGNTRFKKGEQRWKKTQFKKGFIPWNKGKHWTEEIKEKLRKAKIGTKKTKETRRKMSLSHGGTGTPVRPLKRYYHLMDYKYKKWRSLVFERDNWTCRTCGRKSEAGDQVYLHPHHIMGWAKYPKLRYKVENGVTLCKECHRLTFKKH